MLGMSISVTLGSGDATLLFMVLFIACITFGLSSISWPYASEVLKSCHFMFRTCRHMHLILLTTNKYSGDASVNSRPSHVLSHSQLLVLHLGDC